MRLPFQDTLDPLLTMTASPKAITSPVALRSVAGIDEKMHEDREESKAEIPLRSKFGGTNWYKQKLAGCK
jgi:hypothetical protein